MKQGDIYLVDFGNSKDSFSFGKKRPVIVYQTDKLNYAIDEEIYDYVVVIPLSTKKDIVTDEFRVKIKAKDELKQNSFAVVNSICFLHKSSFIKKIGKITKEEDKNIKEAILNLFDFKIMK